jgi:hypothetical protein
MGLHAAPGVYCLLLGSGVSRSAAIPTGWEVVLSMVERIAGVTSADTNGDPAAWYEREHGEPPDYATLLERLAPTPATRRELLQHFFEPTSEQRERGERVPTAAHHAIASLVRRGFVKVILTTNFDRLMEQALDAAGVHPTVVSSIDGIRGMVPLTHAKCVVVKVHGDYLDERIRNTTAEISAYEPELDRLLDRIFDEYGLIVCGWSGDYDAALRAAIRRAPSRRYPIYWATIDEPGAEAARLISDRGARVLRIIDADNLFPRLSDMVSVLERMGSATTLTVPLVVGTMKRYIERRESISRHDLMVELTDRVTSRLNDDAFHDDNGPVKPDELDVRLRRYENLLAPLTAAVVTGVYWDDAAGDEYVRSIKRILGTANVATFSPNKGLRLYPALYIAYAMGIASVLSDHFSALARFAREEHRRDGRSEGDRLPLLLYPENVANQATGRLIPGMSRRYTPLSDWLFDSLGPFFREYVGDVVQYETAFARFEYINALIYGAIKQRKGHSVWGPFGRFQWQEQWVDNGPTSLLRAEAVAQGESWPPLRAGVFDSDADGLKLVIDEYEKLRAQVHWG